MASLEILLDRRNRWEQVISLELFTGVKDIFRDQLPQEASRKQNFMLTLGSVTPVPLFEFELKELFVEATVKSGCKWWLQNSRPSHATVNVRRSLWSTSFVCRHHGDTDIWFSVQCPNRFHLENCVMQFTAVVQRPERL